MAIDVAPALGATSRGPAGNLLEVTDLSCRIGGVQALEDVSLQVGAAEFVGIVGPNGAGKTTLFNTLSGFLHPQTGSIRLVGHRIERWSPPRIARAGLVRTFQNRGGFSRMTVHDNLRVAARDREHRAQVGEVAARLGFVPVLGEPAATLSLARRKVLGLAMAVLGGPQILLLDEPLAGLDEVDRENVMSVVVDTHRSGVAICMIEHDIPRTLRHCERVVVLEHGHKVADDTPAVIRDDPEFIRAYLEG